MSLPAGEAEIDRLGAQVMWGFSLPQLIVSCIWKRSSSTKGWKSRGRVDDPWETEIRVFPRSCSLLRLWSGRFPGAVQAALLCLQLIYFIAGVLELLCWLQHRIWNFLPEQLFVFGNPAERDFGMPWDMAGAQLVQAQGPPSPPAAGPAAHQGARAPAPGPSPPAPGGSISNLSSASSSFCVGFSH